MEDFNIGMCKILSNQERKFRSKVRSFHKSIYEEIFNYHGRCCNSCGCKECLEVHHQRYELNHNLDNFLVLCKSCHLKLHSKSWCKDRRNIIRKQAVNEDIKQWEIWVLQLHLAKQRELKALSIICGKEVVEFETLK